MREAAAAYPEVAQWRLWPICIVSNLHLLASHAEKENLYICLCHHSIRQKNWVSYYCSLVFYTLLQNVLWSTVLIRLWVTWLANAQFTPQPNDVGDLWLLHSGKPPAHFKTKIAKVPTDTACPSAASPGCVFIIGKLIFFFFLHYTCHSLQGKTLKKRLFFPPQTSRVLTMGCRTSTLIMSS